MANIIMQPVFRRQKIELALSSIVEKQEMFYYEMVMDNDIIDPNDCNHIGQAIITSQSL